MSTDPATVIPWRAGCPHREAALGWLLPRLGTVVLGIGADPWVKAAAITDAVKRSSSDIVVIHDGDVWSDGLADAVAAVRSGAPWATPHHPLGHGESHDGHPPTVRRLTEEATTEVLAGAPLHGDLELEREHHGILGGGVVVLPRTTYLDVPLDHRFAGWGQEDVSWGIALTCLAGEPWRGRAALWHLWHPPAPRITSVKGSEPNWALFTEYRDRKDQPAAMRELVPSIR